jgi:2-hydroxy-palmitic acid dioxygenase Mpo1-like
VTIISWLFPANPELDALMLVPPLDEDPLVADWHQRHARPVSLVLHILGIPFLVLAIVLVPLYLCLASLLLFVFAFGAFLLSYAIQFLGHLCEWSEPGEITHLRRFWVNARSGSARGLRKASTAESTS